MQFDPDPTSVVRIFNGTTQRVKGCFSQLNSHASFVLYADRQNVCIVWYGKLSIDKDRFIARELGEETRREMATIGDVFFIDERIEDRKHISPLLSLLWVTENDYFSERKKAARLDTIFNSPKFLYKIEREGGHYSLRKTGSFFPNEQDNSVPKFPQDAKLFTSFGMVILCVADQWDLWIGEKVGADEKAIAKSMIKSIASEHATLDPTILGGVVFGEVIRIAKQRFERAIYRSHFQDDWEMGSKIVKRQVS